ncbi:MAG: chitobiase/beta-hexosaminidase C-terminal domain-containing protein, partial [Prevotella sp.]|nr:chitobiase/beta-hexosaminidase C-terminal domain-containing protein [Prevotella sp.]
ETPWADKADGQYDKAFQVTLSAVSADKNAKVVYTLDGSTPSATNGTTVESGTKISITADCTLKVGLLTAGSVKKVIAREYTLSKFRPYTIKVYVNADEARWDVSSGINYWTWGGDGSHGAASGWPGDNVSATEKVNGKSWFVKEYTINKEDDVVDFVFSTGSGTPQTEDVNNIRQTSFILVSAATDSKGHYRCNVTATGISAIKSTGTKDNWYTLQGVRVKAPTQKGIYIRNGHKVVVR